MTSVLFLDPVAAGAYGGAANHGIPLGGTEATVLRVAARMSRLGHRVAVAQKARGDAERDEHGVLLLPYHPERALEPNAFDNVVLLRAQKLMKRVAAQYPGSRRLLWLHCFPGRHRRGMLARAAAAGFGVVTVSQALREAVLQANAELTNARVEVVYNPVEVDDCRPAGPRDRNKLVFFSSPHKGIEQVLQRFAELHARHPELRLYVANPGYIPGSSLAAHPGVVDLGPLDHAEVLKHVAEAFCVFYAQSSFAETFGLVFAEANALGTPVLAHPLGAAPEILGPEQLVDCDDPEKVAALFDQWRAHGTPVVGPRRDFDLTAVTSRWLELLA